jgi:hypothetical protein
MRGADRRRGLAPPKRCPCEPTQPLAIGRQRHPLAIVRFLRRGVAYPPKNFHALVITPLRSVKNCESLLVGAQRY